MIGTSLTFLFFPGTIYIYLVMTLTKHTSDTAEVKESVRWRRISWTAQGDGLWKAARACLQAEALTLGDSWWAWSFWLRTGASKELLIFSYLCLMCWHTASLDWCVRRSRLCLDQGAPRWWWNESRGPAEQQGVQPTWLASRNAMFTSLTF